MFKKNVLLLTCLNLFCLNAFSALPESYNTLSACSKQELLWSHIKKTEHKNLPELENFGIKEVLAMSAQSMFKKKKHFSDEAPKGWKKYLHRRGAVAKIAYTPRKKNDFTGLFKGADCGLLRLSLTYRPNEEDRAVAPGLALKVLRDGKAHSSNVSALYSLEGQGKNHNFFKNALSNIVPIGNDIGLKLVHNIFKRVTDYPEELLLKDFAEYDKEGNKLKKFSYPTQIFFVPNKKISKKFSPRPHDFRKDILSLPKRTTLYTVYALSRQSGFNYQNYTPDMIRDFVKSSVPIGDITTTSKFKASEFGDTGLFFRHEVRPKTSKKLDPEGAR
jgi:hypothetical protein